MTPKLFHSRSAMIAIFILLLLASTDRSVRAEQRAASVGKVEVWVTAKKKDGTLRPLPGVEIQLSCDRTLKFPPIQTDRAGMATISAAYSLCTLRATSSGAAGGRDLYWESHVEFSGKPARLDLSTEDATSLPVLTHDVAPEYPEALRAAGIGGSVYVETTIRRDGTVGKVFVVASSNHGFDKAALSAVKQRRYEPALEHGIPIDMTLRQEIEFGPQSETADSEKDAVKPVLISMVDPMYPAQARARMIEGWVVVMVAVDKEGNVSEATVQSATDPIFKDAALTAVRQRKYQAAGKPGEPVAAAFPVRIDFRMQ
jgi:TonB family protein